MQVHCMITPSPTRAVLLKIKIGRSFSFHFVCLFFQIFTDENGRSVIPVINSSGETIGEVQGHILAGVSIRILELGFDGDVILMLVVAYMLQNLFVQRAVLPLTHLICIVPFVAAVLSVVRTEQTR